ncbi:MAG: RagB/SusD family nutrient uptake outer membrane protein [Candidatus Cyclobacteriaceae bacterium M3_2C_046]
MKKILVISFLILVFTSCQDEFLNLTPVSQLNVNDFYKTALDMENAVNAAYASLHPIYEDMYVFAEVRSDNATVPISGSVTTQDEFDRFYISSTNPLIDDMWENLYRGIARTNVVIGRIENVNMEEGLKSRFEGEIKFLRALMYFHLVSIYGDVPLVTNEISSVDEGYQHVRVPKEEIYDLILQDIDFAKQVLPERYQDDKNIGRATKGAAKTLLAKVYMKQGDYANALTELKSIIDSNQYDLLDNYEDIFDPAQANHKESIFEVQYKGMGAGVGSSFQNSFAPQFSGQEVVEVGSGFGNNVPTEDLVEAFSDDDLRKAISVQPGFTFNGVYTAKPYTAKFLGGVPFQPSDADNNFPVFRYADVLLMYAEALNEQGFVPEGDAFMYLNEVRIRAGLPPISTTSTDPELKVENQEDFRLALEEERRLELAFENHRWFDLVRTDRAIPVMTSKGFDVSPYQLIFPIPQSQIDVNPDAISQNPGYDL